MKDHKNTTSWSRRSKKQAAIRATAKKNIRVSVVLTVDTGYRCILALNHHRLFDKICGACARVGAKSEASVMEIKVSRNNIFFSSSFQFKKNNRL